MTRHFAVFPSSDPRIGLRRAAEWQAKGYEVLVGLDADKMCAERDGGPHVMCLASPWTGFYGENGINVIVRRAFELGADLVTQGSDDMMPPEQGADVHAAMYFKRFPDGYGVMQCTGDRQGEIIGGRVNSERICGSPTFGREWHRRAFSGAGGFPRGFRSFFADELLYEVARRLEVLYQEPLLKIDHEHWSFKRGPKRAHHERAQENWILDAQAFEAAKLDGFKAYVESCK